MLERIGKVAARFELHYNGKVHPSFLSPCWRKWQLSSSPMLSNEYKLQVQPEYISVLDRTVQVLKNYWPTGLTSLIVKPTGILLLVLKAPLSPPWGQGLFWEGGVDNWYIKGEVRGMKRSMASKVVWGGRTVVLVHKESKCLLLHSKGLM